MKTSKEVIYAAAVVLMSEARKAGQKCEIFTVLPQIMMRYSEGWRFYHNLDHIADGIKQLSAVRHLIEDPICIYFAWLCHDIIYIPGCGDNELRSADLAVQLGHECGIDKDRLAVIYQMIRATKGHQIPENFTGSTSDLGFMLDVDLSGLADEYPQYLKVGQKLCREAGITAQEFASGNAKFSSMLLGRPAIYKTPPFARLENRARRNLKKAVALQN